MANNIKEVLDQIQVLQAQMMVLYDKLGRMERKLLTGNDYDSRQEEFPESLYHLYTYEAFHQVEHYLDVFEEIDSKNKEQD